MDLEQEAVLDRISKLMAKAKGTNNEHEAAIFMAKAAEMLAKHNLSEALLRERDVNRSEGPIGGHPYKGRVPDRWRELILMGCCKVYFCKLTSGYGRQYTVYGREHNAVVAKLMAEYLFATVKRMAREYSPHKAEQGDFRRGAGLRLYQRLVELYNTQNAPPPVVTTGTTLPALYAGEENAVQAYMENLFGGGLKAKAGRGMKLGSGAAAGRAAANGISLNTQVGRETRASRMLG